MVELYNVYADYMDNMALNNINLTVDEGDFLALFGNDDVGKTILLHTIVGYAEYYGGVINVFGKEVSSLKPDDYANIRFVPDEVLVERMPVKQFFDMAAHATGAYDKDLQNKMCEKYCIDTDERMDEMTYQDNKLVQIIAAICAVPKLLIFDEPRQYLTRETWKLLCNDLKWLNDIGTTVIISVEQYEDIDGFCNCYACLRQKQLVAVDNIESGMVYHPAKVVTVTGGNYQAIEEVCNKCISEKEDTRSYIYDGTMNRLMMAIAKAACRDWTVEKLLFEEELVGDYSRWE